MKKIAITALFISLSFALAGQGIPDWLDEDFRRMKFPETVYLTGFVYRIVENGVSETTQQAKIEAQADLVKQVRLMLKSKTQTQSSAQSINGRYEERESFANQTSAEANAEIIGMKTETYLDQKAQLVYAFAYANKYELTGYYKSNLTINIGQIESFVKTATDLEANNEKSKARQQLENARPIFEKIRSAQDLLIAIDANTSIEDLQQTKTESLYNQLTQMQARLAQGVYVYVQSSEDLFGVSVNIVTDKLMGVLAKRGCSFVDDSDQADFILSLSATARKIENGSTSIVFCYGDVTVELYSNSKQKTVYRDEISHKGGSNNYERAGRKAFEDVAALIADKISAWIE